MSSIKSLPSALKKRSLSMDQAGVNDHLRYPGPTGSSDYQSSRRPSPGSLGSVDKLPSYYTGGVRSGHDGQRGSKRSGPQR